MSLRAVTAEQMSEIDRRAQEEYGISQSALMENAGRAVAEEIVKDLEQSTDHSQQSTIPGGIRTAVICGKGNNGGDGFVAARYLAQNPIMRVTIFVPSLFSTKGGAAAENFDRATKKGIEIFGLNDFFAVLHKYDVALDAMFGTGFKGEVSGEYAEAGKALNISKVKIYAVDIPSGLDATTGKASEHTPKAYKTVTFGLPKTGFFLNDGPRVCGEIVVKDIGFPSELLKEYI